MPAAAPLPLRHPSPSRSAFLLAWSLLQRGGREAIVLLFYIITVRFLQPGDLGLASLIQIFIFLMKTLGNAGLPQALLQRTQVDDATWDAAFWHLLRSHTRLSLVCLILGSLTGLATGHPTYVGYAACSAVVIVLYGAHQIPYARLQKELRFERLAGRTLASSLLSSGLCLGLAASGFGVWSLLFQAIAYEAANAVISWQAIRWRPSPASRNPSPHLPTLLDFGRPLAWSGAVQEACLMIERAGIGLFLGIHDLGLFHLGRRLSRTYQFISSQPITDIADATLPHRQHHLSSLRRSLIRILQLQSALALPALGITLVLPLPMILSLLGSRWAQVAPLAPVFALALLPGLVFFNPLMTGLRALGHSRPLWFYCLLFQTAQTGTVVLASTAGLLPAVCCLALFPWLTIPWTWRFCHCHLAMTLRPLLVAVFPAVLACATACLLTLLSGLWLPITPLPRFLCGATLFLAVYLIMLGICLRRTLTALFRQLRTPPHAPE